MIKRVLFKDLDINVINLGNIFDEARKRGLTGFFRATYWNRDDYLLFVDGAPFKLVSIYSDGRRIVGALENFKLEEREGTGTFAECTLDDLVGFQEYHHDPGRSGALFFFPFGTVVQETTPLSFLDLDKEFLLAQKSHLSGYMALYTQERLLGMVIFQEGVPVAVFGGDNSFASQAVDYINANLVPAKSFMSMYTLEYEILSFMYSMHSDNVHSVDSKFMTYTEAKDFVEQGKRNAIILIEGGGIHRYDLFFRGQQVDRLVKEKGLFVTDEEPAGRLSVKAENMPDRSIWVYEVSIIEKPLPIEVSIEVTSEEATVVESEIPVDKVGEVRSLFIKEIGPVGKLIWEKTLDELRFKENAMSLNQVRILIERLKKEFPEEELAKEFLRKIKEVLPDIM